MWPLHTHIIMPAKNLIVENTRFKWSEVGKNYFKDMKRFVGKVYLLLYPNFSKDFVIHTDAPKTKLGAIISQETYPIGFHSCKMMATQTLYRTTERDLPSIVETLKEFRNILLGQHIIIYTDHKM